MHVVFAEDAMKGGAPLGYNQTEIGVIPENWDVKSLNGLAAIAGAIHGEMDRISQALTQRVKDLAERYETPLPQAACRVAELEEKVNAHLKRMGFSWN